MQPIDSTILTKLGYKKLSDIITSDIIIGSDGNHHNILNIIEDGYHPIYKIIFGNSAYAEFAEDHVLYTVDRKESQRKTKNGSFKSIKSIIDNITTYKSKIHNHQVPLSQAIKLEEKPLFINPYVLGVLLGDGDIYSKYSVDFASADQQIVDKCEKLIPQCMQINKKNKLGYRICMRENKNRKHRITNIYYAYLKELNLNGKNSQTKFVPELYKYNSIINRLAILQGLMDTDGFVSKDGSDVSYCTTSELLANDVKFIVQSLGGHANICDKISGNNLNNKLTKSKVVHISIENFVPFRLERKINRYKPRKHKLTRFIKDINYISDKNCRSIIIDSNNQSYLTNNFVCS